MVLYVAVVVAAVAGIATLPARRRGWPVPLAAAVAALVLALLIGLPALLAPGAGDRTIRTVAAGVPADSVVRGDQAYLFYAGAGEPARLELRDAEDGTLRHRFDRLQDFLAIADDGGFLLHVNSATAAESDYVAFDAAGDRRWSVPAREGDDVRHTPVAFDGTRAAFDRFDGDDPRADELDAPRALFGVDADGGRAWTRAYAGNQPSALPETPFYDLDVGLPPVASITPADESPDWLRAVGDRRPSDPVVVDLDGDVDADATPPRRFDPGEEPCSVDGDPRTATDGQVTAAVDGRDVRVTRADTDDEVAVLSVPGDGAISMCVRNGTAAAWAPDPSRNPFVGDDADRLVVSALAAPASGVPDGRFEVTVRAGVDDLLPFSSGRVLVEAEDETAAVLLGP